MNRHSESIALAEQRVAEARADALAECEAARANLRRLRRSPVFIGGVLLGAVALSYFAFRRAEARRVVDSRSAGALSKVVRAVQVLLCRY